MDHVHSCTQRGVIKQDPSWKNFQIFKNKNSTKPQNKGLFHISLPIILGKTFDSLDFQPVCIYVFTLLLLFWSKTWKIKMLTSSFTILIEKWIFFVKIFGQSKIGNDDTEWLEFWTVIGRTEQIFWFEISNTSKKLTNHL